MNLLDENFDVSVAMLGEPLDWVRFNLADPVQPTPGFWYEATAAAELAARVLGWRYYHGDGRWSRHVRFDDNRQTALESQRRKGNRVMWWKGPRLNTLPML